MSQRVTGNMNNNESGFTLIEIMIALVVFSIGMLAMGTLQISSINGNSGANRLTDVGTIASSQVERLNQVDFTDVKAETLKPQGRYWFRTVVTDNTPLLPWPTNPDGTTGPYPISKTVTIEVYGDSEGNNRVLSYSFIKTRAI